MVEVLDSVDDARLDDYVRLTDVQLRSRIEPERGILIAESANVIERALEAGMQPLSLVLTDMLWNKAMHAEEPQVAQLTERFDKLHAPILVVPQNELEKITGFKLTRGALAAFRRPAPTRAQDVLKGARRVLVLEDITNHSNVGAAFRSAAALGADAVLVTPGCYDPFYRRAVRVSMGTVFQVPWARIGEDVAAAGAHGNVERAGGWTKTGIPLLHEAGFKVASMALSPGAVNLDDAALNAEEKLAIVMGTEGEGLSPQTIAASDYVVRIPMHHGVDSLNVAAASAVALWQLRYR